MSKETKMILNGVDIKHTYPENKDSLVFYKTLIAYLSSEDGEKNFFSNQMDSCEMNNYQENFLNAISRYGYNDLIEHPVDITAKIEEDGQISSLKADKGEIFKDNVDLLQKFSNEPEINQ